MLIDVPYSFTAFDRDVAVLPDVDLIITVNVIMGSGEPQIIPRAVRTDMIGAAPDWLESDNPGLINLGYQAANQALKTSTFVDRCLDEAGFRHVSRGGVDPSAHWVQEAV